MSLKKGGFRQKFPKARDAVTWTAQDETDLRKLMMADYALTGEELKRLSRLLAKHKQSKGN